MLQAMKWIPPVTAFLAIVTFSLWHLDRPRIWGDEADTVFLSRSIATSGVPRAFDGKNVMVFENCSQLGGQLVSKKIPWAQYYVAFISQWLFGESTFGMRALFALIGACAFFPLLGLLRGRTSYPSLFAALTLLQPQVLLYNRNARYFSLLIFLTISMMWALLEPQRRLWLRRILLAAGSILLFQTHPLSAGCTVLGMSAFLVLKRREGFALKDLSLLWSGLLVWAVWFWSIPGISGSEPFSIESILKAPKVLAIEFIGRIGANLFDLDFAGVLPLFFWLLTAAMLFRSGAKQFLRESLNELILLVGACLVLGIAAEKAFAPVTQGSNVRYMPQICPLLAILFWSSFKYMNLKEVRLRIGVLIFAFLVLFTNFFNLSFWTFPDLHTRSIWAKSIPWSWWPSIYGEIFFDMPDTSLTALESLRRHKASPASLVQFKPEFMDGVFAVYAGDEFLIRPTLKLGTECANVVERVVGTNLFQKLTNPPDLIVDLEPEEGPKIEGNRIEAIPIFRERPDFARPELIRHSFSSKLTLTEGGIWQPSVINRN